MRTSGRGLCVPHDAAPDSALYRRKRLQHGRRFAALRCQRQCAAARSRAVRDEGRSQEFEFVSFFAKSPRIRDRTAHRDHRGRRQNFSRNSACGIRARATPFPCVRKKRRTITDIFPEPDLLPVHVSAAWRDAVKNALPELPEAKRARFVGSYGITAYDAGRAHRFAGTGGLFRSIGESGRSGKSGSQLDADRALATAQRQRKRNQR